MCTRLPHGLVIVDDNKKKWKLGNNIINGCKVDYIYNISENTKKSSKYLCKFIMCTNKYNHELFIYKKINKKLPIWLKSHKDFIGIPKIYGYGKVMHYDECYNFFIMDKYSLTLNSLIIRKEKIPPINTIIYSLLNILEFLHYYNIIHNDVILANIVFNYKKPYKDVYLIDYELSDIVTNKFNNYRFTFAYGSMDIYNRIYTKRSDLETLCYTFIYWMTGTLPWIYAVNKQNTIEVNNLKKYYMKKNNIPNLFPNHKDYAIYIKFVTYVMKLKINEKIDYNYLRLLVNK